MRRPYVALMFVVTAGLVIGLGGCAGTSGDASPRDETAATVDGSAAPPGSPAPTPGAGPSSGPHVEAAGDTVCLHGTWLADNAYFLAALREFGDAIDTVTGRVTVTFSPDETVTTEYADWLLSGIQEGTTITVSRTGVDTGVYSISDATVSIEESEVGSRLTVTAAGVSMPIAPVPVRYSGAAFTCDDAAASITTPDGTMLLTRE